jgi:hypothetical protein
MSGGNVGNTLGPIRLDDGNLELGFDDRGRIVHFRSRENAVSYLTIPGLEANWRIMVPTRHYEIAYILGAEQTPDSIESDESMLSYRFDSLTHVG